LGTLLGSAAGLIAFILAFIAWLAVYKASFETGWLRHRVAILAAIGIIVVNVFLVALFGAAVPTFFHPF
jgi:hypothetical protein